MSYMIEGGSTTTHSKAKRWLYTEPEASHQLLQLLADVIVDYLLGQIKAGAQVVKMPHILLNIISHIALHDEMQIHFGICD